MLPSNPPPPSISIFEFHVVGIATRNWMLGAALSTGEIVPFTRQYSGTAVAPVPLAATTDADVTTPPDVGSPIDDAGMAVPASWAQATGKTAGDACVLSLATEFPLPPQAVIPADTRAAQMIGRATLHSFMLSPRLNNS
jgi:hypothetical protein